MGHKTDMRRYRGTIDALARGRALEANAQLQQPAVLPIADQAPDPFAGVPGIEGRRLGVLTISDYRYRKRYPLARVRVCDMFLIYAKP